MSRDWWLCDLMRHHGCKHQIEHYTRKCLAFDASARIRGIDVVAILERITREHRFLKRIKADNGPECISKDLNRWAYGKHVELDFSRAGKLSTSALVEAFIYRFRQECLNHDCCMSLEDARSKLTAWRPGYNTERPHSSLGYLSTTQGELKAINEDSTAAYDTGKI